MAWLRTAPFWNVLGLYGHCPNRSRPPPLSNGQTWKKVFQTILASPYTCGQIYAKKNAPNHPSKPLHVPNIEEKGIFLGKGSPFLKCVGSIWALPKSLKSSPPSLSNVQTWKKSVPNHPGKPLHPRAYIGKKKGSNANYDRWLCDSVTFTFLSFILQRMILCASFSLSSLFTKVTSEALTGSFWLWSPPHQLL